LERGQHLHITDDHEYWNDYPFEPVPLGWPALTDNSYRELVGDLTKRAADLIQLHNFGGPGSCVGELRLTETVSMFVADTRRTRSERRFLDPTFFNRLLEWVDGLNGPGILILGQPIVHKARGYFDTLDTLLGGFFHLLPHLLPPFITDIVSYFADLLTFIGDRNLPEFAEQYITLLNALQNAAHDVLILTGDIHIGRVSRIWMLTPQGASRKVFEVISSPLRILPRAATVWNEGTALPFIPADPRRFGEGATPSDEVSGTVEYLSAVPTESGRESQDHFMVLRLHEGDIPGSLLVRITPFVLSDGPGDPEELSSIDITLNDGLRQVGAIITPDQVWLEAIVGEESAKSFAVTNYDDQPVSIRILPSFDPPFLWEAKDLALDPGTGFRHAVTYQPVEPTTRASGPDRAVLTVDVGGTLKDVGLLGVGLTPGTPPPAPGPRRRAANQRMKLNHATAVKRRYEAAMQVKVAEAKGEAVLSPQAQMKALLIEAQEELDKWKRRAEEGASLFDVRKDTPKAIARILVEQCATTRANAIARAILAELKRKEAHAR
jgi:hypothetical protein